MPTFGPGVVFDVDHKTRAEQFRFFGDALKTARLERYVPQFVSEARDFFGAWGQEGVVDLKDALAELTVMTAARTLLGRGRRGRGVRARGLRPSPPPPPPSPHVNPARGLGGGAPAPPPGRGGAPARGTARGGGGGAARRPHPGAPMFNPAAHPRRDSVGAHTERGQPPARRFR